MKGTFTLSTIAALAVALLLITGIGVTNFIIPAHAPEPARLDTRYTTLTGEWRSNDGGTYYLRQIGDTLWWNGMSGGNDGRTYNNVFKGTITYVNNTIVGEWADVPRGTNMNAGKMNLQWSYTTLQKIFQTGGFGPTLWEKVR